LTSKLQVDLIQTAEARVEPKLGFPLQDGIVQLVTFGPHLNHQVSRSVVSLSSHDADF
jgi:hypothetical protein